MKRRILSLVLAVLFASISLMGCGDVTVNVNVDEEAAEKIQDIIDDALSNGETADEATEESEEDNGASEPLTAGVYYQYIQDEYEGVAFEGIDYIELFEDGTGMWCAQDNIEIQWDENSIDNGYEKSEVKLVGDQLTVYRDDMESEYSKLSGNFVKPMVQQVDEEDVPDGIYPAKFFSVEDTDGVKTIAADLYTEDWYDLVDISLLQDGDAILVSGRMYVVSDVEINGNTVIINGGLENGGVELINPEDSNGYRYWGMDDESSYSYQLFKTFTLSETATFTDSDLTPNEEHVYSYDEIADVINNDDGYFYQGNVRVEIKDGEIVSIVRRYTP